MITSTRECHVMDIGIRRDLLKETFEKVMETLTGPDSDQIENTWEGSIEEAMKKFRPELQEELWNKRSIYHLPEYYSKQMKSSTVLTPQLVSFGPYHHGDQKLKLVEDYKQISLLRFLYKAKLPLGDVIEAMNEVVEELQAHYEYLEDKWKNKMKFLKIMITDGCFMLEVLRTDSSLSHDRNESNDLIFGSHAASHIIPHIKKEMIMLENQLPLLTLKVLLSVEAHETKTDREINNLVFKFFNKDDMLDKTTALGLHVLDLYRKSFLWKEDTRESDVRILEKKLLYTRMLTAVELHEVGVRFETSESGLFNSIDFNEGILKLPHLLINNTTELTFLNLMAFEHTHTGLLHVVTSYICFLGELIRSASDVQLLRSANIIDVVDNVSDKDAAAILKRLTKEVLHEWISEIFNVRVSLKIYSKRICGKVNTLLITKVRKWFSILMNLYFNNPWSTIGVIVAAVVLVLTFIQTYYAIVSYKYPKNNV